MLFGLILNKLIVLSPLGDHDKETISPLICFSFVQKDLLLHEEEVGGIDGIRVCRNAPLV
jgi:hypothetical protein